MTQEAPSEPALRDGGLDRLVDALAAASTVDAVADAVFVEALRALGAPYGALGLAVEGGTGLSVTRQRGFDVKDAQWRAVDLTDDTPLVRCFLEGVEAFYPEQRDVLAAFPGLEGQLLDVRSRAALPLRHAGELLGVLYVAYDEHVAFDDGMRRRAIGVAGRIAQALWRAERFEETQRSAEQASLLHRITAELADAVTVEEVERVTAHAAMDAVDADASLLGMRGDGTIVYRETDVYPDELRQLLPTSLEAGTSPVADVLATGTSIRFGTSAEAVRDYPTIATIVERLPFESRAFVPVIGSSGSPAGVLVASSRRAGHFDATAVALLEAIGRQCGQSLERAQLSRRERQARQDLERALSRLSRLQTVSTALSRAVSLEDVVSVALEASTGALGALGGAAYLGEGDVLRCRAVHGPILALAAGDLDVVPVDARMAMCAAYRSGNLEWVPDAAEWERRYPSGYRLFIGVASSTIAIPLVVEDRVSGVLTLVFEDERVLDRAERRLARSIGQQTGVAIERTMLHEREADRARRTERLQHLIAELASSATPADVAGVLTTTGADLVGAQGAAVLLAATEDEPAHVAAAAGFGPVEDGARYPWEVLDTGAPLFLVDQEAIQRRYPGVRAASLAVVPLRIRLEVVGAVTFLFRERQAFGREQAGTFASIASEAAQGIDRARSYLRQREISRLLQDSLRTKEPSSWNGTGIASWYSAGAAHLDVGGDWYDVLELPNGRLAVSIGDVVGRGLRAAAAMGQLRSALRGLALECRGPGATLEGLNRFASVTGGTELATVVYGELDPTEGTFTYASAGHPPPIACVDGRVEVLDGGRSPLLAAGYDGRRVEATVALPPGSTVVLYTDGLVERRTESLDLGIERLVDALRGLVSSDLERLTDGVIGAMLADVDQNDDAALLCLRIGPAGATFSLDLPSDPTALHDLRSRLTEWLLSRHLSQEDVDAIVLSVHEATANAIEHGYRAVAGTIEVSGREHEGHLTFEIRDHGTWRDGAPSDVRGRGLPLMRTLMDRVELRHGADGTSVTLQRSTVRAPAASS